MKNPLSLKVISIDDQLVAASAPLKDLTRILEGRRAARRMASPKPSLDLIADAVLYPPFRIWSRA